MRIPATNEFFETIQTRYPVVVCAEETVREVVCVSIEDMRSESSSMTNTMAKMVFAKLLKPHVRPLYIIPSYLCKNHSTLTYWIKTYDSLYETDKLFRKLADRANEVFQKKIKDGNI